MNSFNLLREYLKNVGSSADLIDIPSLDKIPTNEFIGNFLEDEEDEADEAENGPNALEGSGIVSAGTQRTRTSYGDGRRPSGKTGSARLSARERLTEDDRETVLDISDSYPAYDDTGQLAYQNACKKWKVLPCSSFHRKLGNSTEISMKNYGAGPRGAKAIAVPMVINSQVTSLNLEGNSLTAAGLTHITTMMQENDFITHLNLADNALKSEGAKLVIEMLQFNHNIVDLDLSKNGFTDKDAPGLFKAIEDHSSLKTVLLAHNAFGELSGKYLKTMIAENGNLNELDLSWNQIRGKAVTDVAKGLKENVSLKILDLSWNGFGDKGCKELAAALKVCPLVELSLTSNRVSGEGVIYLIKALKDNDDLTVLRLAKNPLAELLVKLALDGLKMIEDLHLQTLDLSDILFGPTFKAKVEEVQAIHSQFTCIHGYSDSYGKRRLKTYSVVGEAMHEMRKYCEAQNINIVELFSRFDNDDSMSVSHEEFRQGLREARIPLSDYQIQELISTLDQDGDGEIDFSEMVMGAEKYKD